MSDDLADRAYALYEKHLTAEYPISHQDDLKPMADLILALAQRVQALEAATGTGPPPATKQRAYSDGFCPGGCDCSCCYGYFDGDCHCRQAICNCGGDRAAHGQKPLS